ncbi:hypothetical protein KY345_04295 [Candidatus Woesearchaeota archaeon]|nr:hypothetical protein [Candidatus Woesearchaeota archaeon]
MSEAPGTRLVLNVFIQIIISATILIALYGYVQAISSDDSFEKTYLARDLAITLEAIQTAQGNTAIHYLKDTDYYTLKFTKDRLEVFSQTDQPEPPAYLRGISTFEIDPNLEFQNITIRSYETYPTFTKTNNKLQILDPILPYNLELYGYENIDTKNEKLTIAAEESDIEDIIKITIPELEYNAVNPDILIKKTEQNTIYSPMTKERRKLASIIANRMIERGYQVVILPTKTQAMRIEAEAGIIPRLSDILKESLEEYNE